MDLDSGKSREELLAELQWFRAQQAHQPAKGTHETLNGRVEFEAFFDAIPYPASFLDRNLVYVAVNKAYERYFGIPKDDLLGVSPADILPGAIFEKMQPHLARCLQGEDVEYDMWFDFPRMGRLCMHVGYHPRRNDRGETIGILHISRDVTIHHEMEQRVVEDRNRLDAILASLDTGLSLINKNLTVAWVNDTIFKLFPNRDPVGNPCHVFFAGRKTPCLNCPTIRCFQSGQVEQAERFDPESGRWYSIIAQPIQGNSGAGMQVLEGITDITARKLAEEALERSEQKWRNILVNTPQIGISLDPQGRITFANDHFLNLTGWEREGILGKDWFDTCIPDSLRDKIRGIFATTMAQKHAHCYSTYENEILHRNGEVLTIAWSNVLTLDPKGIPMEVTCLGVDVTERRRAELAIRHSEATLESIFRAAPVGVGLVVNRVFKRVNVSMCSMSGYSEQELLGQNARLVYPDDAEYEFVGREKYRQISEFGTGTVETRWRRKDGTVIDVLLSSTPLDQADLSKGVTFTALDISARKQAEEMMKQSHATMLAILESVPAHIYVADLETHKVLYLNKAVRATFGSDCLGKSCFEVFRGLNAPCANCTNPQLLDEHGRPRDVQIWEDMNPLTGRWYLNYDKAVPWVDGRLTHIQVAMDISDRKQVEEALKDSELRFKALHNASFGGIAIHDKGLILDCNLGLSTVSGFTVEELIGMDGLLLIAERSRQEVMQNILSGFEQPYEVYGVRKNGEEYPLRLQAQNIPYKGRIVRAVEFRDITDSRKAEEALRQTQQEFQSIFENSQVGILLLRGGRYIALANQRVADILGYESPGELKGECVRKLHLDEEHFLAFGEHYYKPLAWGNQTQVEYQLRHKDGSAIWCIISGMALDPSDLSKGVIWVLDDLTRRKTLEAQLTTAKEAAEAANLVKSEFLANMSHEIRTPLNGILGMLQLLQMTAINAEQAEYVTKAVQSSRRLTRLLSDILDLSRVEAGKMDIVMQPFDFKDAMEAVIQLFAPVAAQKHVQLRMIINPIIPRQLQGDAPRLQQVLSNLIGNAIKFTNAGYVEVEAHPLPARNAEEYRVLFTVADTGIGIPDDKLPLLFRPFSQVSQGYRREFQGAGLGLSICKRLVNLMGGNIAVESHPEVGTSVYFCIAFSNAHCAIGTGVAPKQDAETKRSILLVEDDLANQFAIMRMAEMLGHDVVTVDDGQQALNALRAGQFELVLMDIQMPVLDGVEATRRIRAGEAGQDKAGIPILALTAYAMAGDRERFMAAGMDGYLAKPVELKALEESLRTIGRKVNELP